MLLAGQVSPKSQHPKEFYKSYIFGKGETKEGEMRQRRHGVRKRRTATHVPGCVCVCLLTIGSTKTDDRVTQLCTHTHVAAATAAATADP